MPVNHEAFLTMREYLKLGCKGAPVNPDDTKFYAFLFMRWSIRDAWPISVAHLSMS
jgi:hypothetical protein